MREAEGLLSRTRVVINEWKGIPREQEVYDYAESLGVSVFKLQRLETLTTNMDYDRPWFYSMRTSILSDLEELMQDIMKM